MKNKNDRRKESEANWLYIKIRYKESYFIYISKIYSFKFYFGVFCGKSKICTLRKLKLTVTFCIVHKKKTTTTEQI